MSTPSPDLSYAAARVFRIAFPPVHVTEPSPGIRVERDVTVAVRDGTKLRMNVHRPERAGRFPVILSAHPYGKDVLPRRVPFGYLPLKRYRFIRQAGPVAFSALTGWEAPDPSYWVPRGYVVINLDLRGFGASEGTGTLLSDQEAADYVEVIEWAAHQPWSSGRVGLNGVSYLAISQWKVAALRPPALAAICPWEGFSDVYRDVAYPGGVREDGFMPFWANATEHDGRTSESLRAGQLAHPEWDDFWAALTPDLERIEVPALVCASFSDQGLHSRGCFEAFRRIGSKQRFLYTHRAGKWSTYYGPDALDWQTRFFDCFLKGEDNGMRASPPVRLEVRSAANEVHAVRSERSWPPPSVRWTALHLAPGELRQAPLAAATRIRFRVPEESVEFVHRIEDDMELSGPMKLRLHVELSAASDAYLFVAVCKARPDPRGRDRDVVFEGSFGFGYDVVAKGWLRIAHRHIDTARSEPHRPFHPHDRAEPLASGEVAPVDIEILPSATHFARGDSLRLVVQGRWFWRRSSLIGMFPGGYAESPAGTVILHVGGERDAHLLVPRVS
jgi:predicted acyl esterase